MLRLLAQETQSGSSLIAFAPLILMGVVFYFLLIRPQQRRSRQQQALLRSVEVGDEIVTTGGVFGTVVDIDEDDDVITVEIAPGTEIRMLRGGIGRRLTEDDEIYDEDEGDDADDDADAAESHDASDDQQGPIQSS
jgi:preprotein translocase subunit YajC